MKKRYIDKNNCPSIKHIKENMGTKKGRTRAAVDADAIVNEMVKMRINGASTYTLHQYMIEEFDLASSTRLQYIGRMRRQLAELIDKDIDSILGDSISKLEELLEKSNDKRLKLDIIKELNRVRGLYSDRLDVTSNGETITGEIKVIIIGGKEEDK
jgi:hypothetical protein